MNTLYVAIAWISWTYLYEKLFTHSQSGSEIEVFAWFIWGIGTGFAVWFASNNGDHVTNITHVTHLTQEGNITNSKGIDVQC